MNKRMIDYYMNVCEQTAQLSYAKKLKVGSIVVKDNKIISCGYNGSPSGWDNHLEYEIQLPVTEYMSLS